MKALTSGLGRAYVYSVVAPDGMIRRDEEGNDSLVEEEPWWATLLRLASGMEK